MRRMILRRIIWSIPVLLLITFVTFWLIHLVPGGPYSMSRIEGSGQGGQIVPPQVRANIEARYGLDKPVWEQYLIYMERLVFHFDMGPSMWRVGRTVDDIIFGGNYLREVLRERLLATFGAEAHAMTFAAPPDFLDSLATVVTTRGQYVGSMHITWSDRLQAVDCFLSNAPVMVSAQLGLFSMTLAIGVGIPAGVMAALNQGNWVDHLVLLLSVVGISVPNFVLGLGLILVFALGLRWLPTYGWGDDWKQVILPTVTLSMGGWPLIARLMRASMLDVMHTDYIRTAHSKGLTEPIVVWRHALRNALVPVTTALAPLAATWLTGSFLVESVFSIGGIGKMLVSAVAARDYPLIMGIILIYSTVLVGLNLLVDLSYTVIDPRVRVE